MNLKEWCKIDEALYNAETNEQYLQFAGHDYDKKNIENLSKMKYLVSEIFVRSFSEPRILLLSSIENISDAITKPLELKLHELRSSKIKNRDFKYGGKHVTWNTWRQFNSTEIDHKKRRVVFDDFVKKTKYIAPVINLRFKKIRKIYSDFSEKVDENKKGSLNPLDGYLLNEKITLSKLKKLVSDMGARATTPFMSELNFGTDLIGKEPEYYDDFYFFRNRIFQNMEKYFTKINPVVTVKRTLGSIGFDFSKIHFDTDDRPNKYPSPICFFVKIPDDIRVLYKSESPYFNLSSLLS